MVAVSVCLRAHQSVAASTCTYSVTSAMFDHRFGDLWKFVLDADIKCGQGILVPHAWQPITNGVC